jgi:hypothetical protein
LQGHAKQRWSDRWQGQVAGCKDMQSNDGPMGMEFRIPGRVARGDCSSGAPTDPYGPSRRRMDTHSRSCLRDAGRRSPARPTFSLSKGVRCGHRPSAACSDVCSSSSSARDGSHVSRSTTCSKMCASSGQTITLRQCDWPAAIRCDSVSRHLTG